MRDAAVPGDHQQFVVREKIAQRVAIRKNRAGHQRPGDHTARVHRAQREHFVAVENRFGDQRAGDSVGNCIHCFICARFFAFSLCARSL